MNYNTFINYCSRTDVTWLLKVIHGKEQCHKSHSYASYATEKLMTVSKEGLESVNTVRQLRSKLQNDNFREATDRLNAFFLGDGSVFSWHKTCRSLYMSKGKLERLKKIEENKGQNWTASSVHCENITLRSKTHMEKMYLLSRRTSSHSRNESQ